MSLTVITYNMGDGNRRMLEEDFATLLSFKPNLICLQEAGDRREFIDPWAGTNGFHPFYGNGTPGAASVPILHDMYPQRTMSKLCMPAMYVGPGAGPSWAKAKAMTGVKAEDIWVYNTHMIASATRKGHWLRKRHYQGHVASISWTTNRKRKKGVAVSLNGDFNATEDFKYLKPIADHMRQNTPAPTHGNRIIDLQYTHGLIVQQALVIEGLSSDHNAAMIRIRRRA